MSSKGNLELLDEGCNHPWWDCKEPNGRRLPATLFASGFSGNPLFLRWQELLDLGRLCGNSFAKDKHHRNTTEFASAFAWTFQDIVQEGNFLVPSLSVLELRDWN